MCFKMAKKKISDAKLWGIISIIAGILLFLGWKWVAIIVGIYLIVKGILELT